MTEKEHGHLPRPLSAEHPLEILRFHWWAGGEWLRYRGDGWRISLLQEGHLAVQVGRRKPWDITTEQCLIMPDASPYRSRCISRQGVVEIRFVWHAETARSWWQADSAAVAPYPWTTVPSLVPIEQHLPWDALLAHALAIPIERYAARTWWRLLTGACVQPVVTNSPYQGLPVWLQTAVAGLDGAHVLRHDYRLRTHLLRSRTSTLLPVSKR